MERGEYRPDSEQFAEGYTQQPFSSFAENLQRRYADLVAYGHPAFNKTPAEDMAGLLARMNYDAGLTENTAVQDAAQNIKWAFIALTYPNYSSLFQTEYIREYNQLQREQRKQGDSTTGIEVPGEQTQLLSWMLDQIGVAHDFQDGDITVPFAPMEANMQQIAQENGANLSQRPVLAVLDHETTANVPDLMEEWQETQEGNGQS